MNKINNRSNNIRKVFFKRLFFIFLGILPLFILGNEKGPIRYIAGAGFLFSLYQLIGIIYASQSIVDDFFPPKINSEKITKPFDRKLYYFSNYYFGGSLLFLIFEIRKIDNTISGTQLFWRAGFIGMIMATILTLILKKTNPSVFYLSSRRYVVYFGLFVGSFLFVPSSASFINHFFSEKESTCKNYKIIRKSKGGKRNKESWLYLRVGNDNEERFDVTRNIYDKTKEGEQIQLCTKKGRLGYDFVIDFRIADK